MRDVLNKAPPGETARAPIVCVAVGAEAQFLDVDVLGCPGGYARRIIVGKFAALNCYDSS